MYDVLHCCEDVATETCEYVLAIARDVYTVAVRALSTASATIQAIFGEPLLLMPTNFKAVVAIKYTTNALWTPDILFQLKKGKRLV